MFDQWTWKKHATTKPISQCSKVHVAEREVKWLLTNEEQHFNNIRAVIMRLTKARKFKANTDLMLPP